MKIDFKKPENFSHEEIFVDREELREQFWNVFEELCEREEQWKITVFHYWGMGGIGKSSLLKKIYQEVIERNAGQKDIIPTAFVSLSGRENEIQILCRMVHLLKRQSNFAFPLFEVGMYWLYQKSGNGEWKKEIQTLEERSTLLSGILDFSSGISFAAFLAGCFRLLDKSVKVLRDHFSAHQKRLQYLEHRFPEEIERILPELLAEDLTWNLERSLFPAVIFLDRLDGLRMEISGIDAIDHNDKWLKEMLVEKIPNVIWVFSGREKLSWGEREPEKWQESLYNKKVEEFSPYWMGQYFVRNGAKLTDLEEDLYELTKGIPLYLNLCCELYWKYQKAGKSWDISDFEGKQEVLLRTYVDMLSTTEMRVLFILSCLGEWNQDVIQYIWTRIPALECAKAYDVLEKESYISDHEGNTELHQVIQEQVFAFCTERDAQQVADFLWDYMPQDCFSEWYPVYLRCRMKSLKSNADVEKWFYSDDVRILKDLMLRSNVNGFEQCYREIRKQMRGKFDDSLMYIVMAQFHISNLLRFQYTEQAKKEANYMLRACKDSHQTVSANYRNVVSNFLELKAQALDGQGKYPRALNIRRALCQEECYVGEDSRISRLHNLATSYLQMKDYRKASELADQVLKYRKLHKKESPENYIRALVLKMNIYKERYRANVEDMESAGEMLRVGQEAIGESEDLLGENHDLTIQTESAIGMALSELRLWEPALEILRSARRKLFQLNQGRNEQVDELDFRIAVASGEMGETGAAADIFSSLQEISQSYQEGSEHFGYRCELEKGIALSKEGKHEDAREVLENARKACDEKFGSEDIVTLELSYATGMEEYFLGNYEECQRILTKIMPGVRVQWGEESHLMYLIKTFRVKCEEHRVAGANKCRRNKNDEENCQGSFYRTG